MGTDMVPPRTWGIANLTDYCQPRYQVSPEDEWMRTWFPYGDLSKVTGRIIFSNGLLDPWHPGGYLKNISESLPAIVIEDGAHHLDLRLKDPQDPQSVITARLQEKAIFKGWLKELREEQRLKIA